MIKMQMGPLVVSYLFQDELVLHAGEVIGYDERSDLSVRDSVALRRILLPRPGGRSVYLVIHWNDPDLPAELDATLAAGKDPSLMLNEVLVGSLAPVRCSGCQARFIGAIADTGNPLVADLSHRLQSHSYVRQCPRCGHRLQPHVMEIVRELPGGGQ